MSPLRLQEFDMDGSCSCRRSSSCQSLMDAVAEDSGSTADDASSVETLSVKTVGEDSDMSDTSSGDSDEDVSHSRVFCFCKLLILAHLKAYMKQVL